MLKKESNLSIVTFEPFNISSNKSLPACVFKPKFFSNLYGSNINPPICLSGAGTKAPSNDFWSLLLTNLSNCFCPTINFKSLKNVGLAFLRKRASANSSAFKEPGVSKPAPKIFLSTLLKLSAVGLSKVLIPGTGTKSLIFFLPSFSAISFIIEFCKPVA